VFRPRSGAEPVIRRIEGMILDLGCAVTSVSGWDARTIGLEPEDSPATSVDIAGRHLDCRTAEDVMFVFEKTDGEPHNILLRQIDVFAPEEGMNAESHMPSLIGVDILMKFTIRPRETRCYLDC